MISPDTGNIAPALSEINYFRMRSYGQFRLLISRWFFGQGATPFRMAADRSGGVVSQSPICWSSDPSSTTPKRKIAARYSGIGWNFASDGAVKHSDNEYVRREGDRVVTTNSVEGSFSILKRGVYGVYQHVSEAHLHRYLTEFDFRHSHREKLGVDDARCASLALKGTKGRGLTHETTH